VPRNGWLLFGKFKPSYLPTQGYFLSRRSNLICSQGRLKGM
jgi:hypothetical protein